jgi:hypothetical protein
MSLECGLERSYFQLGWIQEGVSILSFLGNYLARIVGSSENPQVLNVRRLMVISPVDDIIEPLTKISRTDNLGRAVWRNGDSLIIW